MYDNFFDTPLSSNTESESALFTYERKLICVLIRIGSGVSKKLSYTHIPQTHSEFDFKRNLQFSVHVEIVNGTVISFS